MNGANCGKLCMLKDEAVVFINALWRGADVSSTMTPPPAEELTKGTLRMEIDNEGKLSSNSRASDELLNTDDA